MNHKLPYTHFYSIPLRGAGSGFNAFREEMLRVTSPSDKIEPSVFVATSQLHLTLIMLKLHEKEEIELAKQILNKCQSKVSRWLLNSVQRLLYFRPSDYEAVYNRDHRWRATTVACSGAGIHGM